ncbi:MFS transporter [Paraburkholderia tropica]|nr:MFS transporter [Paraburkholderia tropica]
MCPCRWTVPAFVLDSSAPFIARRPPPAPLIHRRLNALRSAGWRFMSEIDSPLRQSAPDTSRDAWPAVASLALGSFASVTTEFLPVGVLPDVVKSFGVSAGHGGLMMTLPGLFAALAAPGVLLVGKRIDRRTLLLALSVLLLASALTSAVSTQFGWMLLGRAMVGASLGAFWSMALAVAGRLVRADHVHYAAAAVFGGATTAMIVGVPFGTFVADLTSWRGAFLAAAALSAIALIVQIVALPALAATSSATPGAARLLAFARNRMAQRSMATITLLFAAHFGTYTFLVPLLNEAGSRVRTRRGCCSRTARSVSSRMRSRAATWRAACVTRCSARLC